MNITEQGVLQQSKLKYSLIHIILLINLCLSHFVYADTTEDDLPAYKNNKQKHHLVFIYSTDNKLQSNIAQSLSEILLDKDPDTVITSSTPEDKKLISNKKPDIIIGIGQAGIQSANKHYPITDKLLLSADQENYRVETESGRDNAMLYMVQPYCRQIHFIKALNDQWKIISLLHSKEKPVDTSAIHQCANTHSLRTYTVDTTGAERLTDKIKDALLHSDILLALPDKNIYNSKTVKNILLTSYRHRKPVIAFSRNFVNAGALASIHSSAEQIAQSANTIIEQYFKQNRQFTESVNYPVLYDISINKQVFRALDLSIPDIEKLKQDIKNSIPHDAGNL